jgi:predicted nucleic acid-binding protein
VSSITEMELIVGCGDSAQLKRVNVLLAATRRVHISEQASQQALDWIRRYRLSHGLAIPDAPIGATALTSGLPLYAKNTRHFQMLPDLELIGPY